MAEVSYTHENGIATVVLCDPPQNRLSTELVAAFAEVLTDLAGRTDTRAVLVMTEGPDFSFGGDFPAWKDVSAENFADTMAQALKLVNLFENLPAPTVIAVQGQCSGGGFEIALRGDIIVAADNAHFSHSEASMGVFTFLGGVQRVAERVGRTRATQWAMTCEKVKARRALDCGLINDVVPLAELETAARRWARQLGSGATRAHSAHKTLLRAWSNGGVGAADAVIPPLAGEVLHSNYVQANLDEAITAFHEGRERPVFKFQGK